MEEPHRDMTQSIISLAEKLNGNERRILVDYLNTRFRPPPGPPPGRHPDNSGIPVSPPPKPDGNKK